MNTVQLQNRAKTQPQTTKIHNPIEKIHQQFRYKGGLSLKYRRECIGMLPEIYKLHIFEKKGFSSMYEYANKLAGISRADVDAVVRLEKRFEDKPALKKTLITGEVSHHKLMRIASIATSENEAELAEKVKLLPKSALDVFVKDERMAQQNVSNRPLENKEIKNQIGLFKPENMPKSLSGQTLNLAEDVETELLELQNKGINVNDLLRQFLAQRKEKLAQEKGKLAKEVYASSQMNTEKDQSAAAPNAIPKPSRYIPAKIRKHITQEHGTKCSIPTCQKPSQEIHHTQRFALAQNHDPHYLAPLCKEHHIVAHLIDQRYQQKRKL